MRLDATVSVEPISIHITLGGARASDVNTVHLASIGRIHASLGGDILGKEIIKPCGTETAQLDHESLLLSIDVGIDQGIKANLWTMPIIDALVTLGHAHRQTASTASEAKDPKTVLSRLPSGISARISLGLISVFVGHEDPNPNCKLKLTRGLWFQTQATYEYAYFNNKVQAMPTRHALTSATRRKLSLPEDLTTQALAQYNSLSPRGGQAALAQLVLMETFVKPIYHGASFCEAGGTSMSHEPAVTPKPQTQDDFVGWDFIKPRMESNLGTGSYSYKMAPLEQSDTAQASRPLVRLPSARVLHIIKRESEGHLVEHRISVDLGHVWVVCDLSHVYCALLAALTLRSVANAWKNPKPAVKSVQSRNIRFDMSLPFLSVHFAFPLQEQIYLHLASIRIWKPADTGIQASTDQVLLFVPSARQVGMWVELGRLKRFYLKASTAKPLAFAIDAEAFRIRIPTSYELSRLILSVNATVKTVKLLIQDLGGRGFSFVRKPGPEAPKRIPKVEFNIKYMSLEARDNPIETSLNLIWRTGLHEQERRLQLEDAFEMKLQLLREAEENGELSDDSGSNEHGARHVPYLTKKAMIAESLARYKLDLFHARSWTKTINGVKTEHRRQEIASTRHMALAGNHVKLPIVIAKTTTTAPLFRATFEGVKFCVEDPGWTRSELIKYMGDVSAPFADDVEFSLMVPLNLSWTMESAKVVLRDYPLPLIRIQPVETGPAWHVETPFIIAEELKGDDSLILVPCEVIPAGCGAKEAKPFMVQVAKTIMPVKTYARPVVKIASVKTTEFTWGNSYQPAIQDVMKVIETLSHPPRDPSPKVGFWDKFRLILHWKVSIDFDGPVHLHLKGSFDPYSVTGLGAGFALAWRGRTRFEINQPNEQYETIQISSDELIIAIPDLTALNDAATSGENHIPASAIPQRERGRADQSLIERRYTKPCARFVNGVRVGFGFAFERTCRPHTCKEQCGETENVFHRACRFFDFKQHQEVILRSPEAIERDEQEIGRSIDSYEGFRSDFIHFSVSVVSPLKTVEPAENLDTNLHSSMHCSPKAFAHFFAWWRLFDHKTSLPIRQGSLFPDAPPASKKFGRSLGTIKYRFNIKDLFLSHMYQQVSQDLWATGKSQSLGVKIRFGEFRADAHQRAQEMRVRHEKLHRDTAIIHKPFYAADLQLKKVDCRGLRADFVEKHVDSEVQVNDESMFKASELQPQDAVWYNIFDFIDADRKPLDRDPRIEIANVGDCPQIFISKRVKARQIMSGEQHDEEESETGSDSPLELESTKFGHEKSHICYLGAAAGVGETQIAIAEERIAELKERESCLTDKDSIDSKTELSVVQSRLKTLYRHRDELAVKERRQIDDDTLQRSSTHDKAQAENRSGEVTFENTIHVHNPRLFFNNNSRNILFKYMWSSRDRKKEEYTTSHAALRGVRDGIQQRIHRLKTGYNQDDLPDPVPAEVAMDMLYELQRVLRDKKAAPQFKLPADHTSDHDDLQKPSIGLPENTIAKPKHSILVLKPQIALRSSADRNAIVLLAVEEVSFKTFQVLDEGAQDSITADVLARNYASIKGLQAFYPNEESLQRERGSYGIPRGLDFVPLEIFLDVRSEATDYDRIVLKTEIAVSIDKFNRLRMPRGLEWPDAKGENGENISHLRIHQDLTTIIIPRITVSATSEHYTALYNIVTDLLMYQDPEHRHRSERVDGFVFAFDRKDRDPQRLLADLFSLQQSIRALSQLQRGYEANVDLLTEEGKSELFKIRTDCLEATEQLFTVFEVIKVNQARDDARAALKSAARTDVRAGSVAWHMLRDDLRPLVKLDIEGSLFSYVSNKDGSTDSAMTFGDLSILNSNADALYPEVVARHESSGSGKKKQKEPMMSISWSTLAPVGGIPIFRHLFVNIFPIRFRIEERVGHQIADYIFNDRVRRRDEQAKGGSKEDKESKRTSSGTEIPPLHRTQSSASLSSQTTNGARHPMPDELGKPDAKFTMVPSGDAAEMRRRAKANFTFVKIMVEATSVVLSYKSEDSRAKRQKKWSVPDMVDFKVKTPNLMYSNKVWSWEDIFEHVKREDFRSAIWSQTGDLLSQVIKKTSIFRSKKALRQVAALSSDFPLKREKSDFSPSVHSNLRSSVEPPSTSDESGSSILGRSLTRSDSPLNPLSRIISSRGRISPSPTSSGYTLNDDSDEEKEESDHEGAVGKAVKGLLGKLKKHRHDGPATSSDDVSSVSFLIRD
ncbi:golgi-body localization protein domain-domain-containing protein [Naematelia encephala]|uniref:Golgi-body localization protein domain-domain-containing protein n=1 Tax=Naematelia encephala TaxID=71784 RepID=A0A1Y2B9F3_9TREE|nr:golgi-body localization protein domain-domain-containing protein [Naematelia encephala]